jgi:uncharacterized membrane protein YgaE (UPF0421/DUF939 family)
VQSIPKIIWLIVITCIVLIAFMMISGGFYNIDFFDTFVGILPFVLVASLIPIIDNSVMSFFEKMENLKESS